MKREIFKKWVLEALRSLGGSGRVIDVAKRIWLKHESELRDGDLFFTWQYDMRWAAKMLRDEGKIKPVAKRGGPMGIGLNGQPQNKALQLTKPAQAMVLRS